MSGAGALTGLRVIDAGNDDCWAVYGDVGG